MIMVGLKGWNGTIIMKNTQVYMKFYLQLNCEICTLYFYRYHLVGIENLIEQLRVVDVLNSIKIYKGSAQKLGYWNKLMIEWNFKNWIVR